MISTAFGVTNLLVVSLVGAGTGLPLGLPPADEDPVMAKIAPEECLVYVSWAGSAAPDAASENHLEQLLAEPEIQLFLTEAEKLLVKAIEKAASEEGEEAEMFAKLGVKWGKKLLYNPSAFYVEAFAFDPTTGPLIKGGAIVNVGDDAAELQKTIGEMLDGFGIERVEVAGVEMHQIQPAPEAPLFTIGVKDKYLYLGVGEGAVEGMVERAKTDAPKWLTDFREQIKVDRVSLIAYGNAKEIVNTGLKIAAMAEPDIAEIGPEKILAMLGLDNVSTVGCVCGLDDSGHITRALVGIDGDAKGLLSLTDGEPLTAADLAPIPYDSTMAVAARFDTHKLFEQVVEIAGKIDPRAKEEMQEGLAEIEEGIGMPLPDVLKALGDTWCIYYSTSEGGYIGGVAATVTIDDREVFDGLQKKLTDMVAVTAGIRGGDGPKLRSTKFAGETIYYMTEIERGFPLAPSWCITDERLIVSLMPQNIKAYLGRGDEYKSIASRPEVAKALEASKPFKIYYQDTPRLFEYLYVMLPMATRMASYELQREGIDFDVALLPSGESIHRHLRPDVITVSRSEAGIEITSRETFPGSGNAIGVALAAAVSWTAVEGGPGIGSPVFAPSAAREMQSKNNLKMIGIAMHNYHDVHGKFPPAYSTDEAGKPLLSWRVHILPFVEQEPLYAKFKLDEPWDSEHNRKLIAEMPELYRAPGSKAEAGKTNYLTVRHKDSAFPGAEQTRFADIVDGSSNTIMVLEAGDAVAVTWTKPDDFVPPMDPAAGLVDLRRKGFLAVNCDGAAHKFKATIDRDALKNLFNRRDGKPINWDDISDRRRRRPRGVRIESFDAPAVEAVPEFKEAIPDGADNGDAGESEGAARDPIPSLPSKDATESPLPESP